MRYGKRVSRVLGLFILIALSAMTLSATVAQAEGEFRIGGLKFGELKNEKGEKGIEKESITGSLTETFNYVVGTLNIAIKCEKLEVVDGKLLLKGIGDMTFSLKECAFFRYKPLLSIPTCKVEEMLISALSLVVASSEKTTYLLFEPLPGKTYLMTYEITGETCPLGPHVGLGVGGSFLGELLPSAKVVQELSLGGHLKAEEELGDGLKLGVYKAVISGKLSLSLSGLYKGSTWAAV